MNNYFTLARPVFLDLGWALAHLLWQGVLIAAALELALILAGRRNARIRYFLCGLALASMPVCFAVTFAQSGREAPPPLAPAAVPASSPASSATTLRASVNNVVVPARKASGDFVLRAFTSWNWNRCMPFIAAAWLTGVLLLGGRKAGGFYLLRRWRRTGITEPNGTMLELFDHACQKIGIDPRRICLKISDLVRVPMTMGWWRPVVLFPACLLSDLGAEEIELLLAHELAHIRRWDYLANLLQVVVETLFFHQPLTWWISHRMRQERENCCDDLVARSPNETLVYAKALLRLETMRSPGAGLVVAASGGVLRRRIERLAGNPTPGMGGGFYILLVMLLFGAVADISFARAQPPLIQPVVSPVIVTQTREFDGDIGRLYHAMVYTQTSVEPPPLNPTSWQFIADMSNNTFPVTGGTVSLPSGSAWTVNPVAVVKPGQLVGAHYLYVQGFKSESELLSSFPYGEYTFNIQPGAPAAPCTVPVAFTGTVPYPPMAPVITNTTWNSGALVLNPQSAIINFTNYPGATLTWEIVIPGKTYIMSAGGGGTSLGSLNLTGMLSYGQTYVAQLRFINRDRSSTASDPAAPKDYGYATMMARIVEFTIKTPAQ
jgi:beta-lactamase regulating signal transducer with metallopeptidase domain